MSKTDVYAGAAFNLIPQILLEMKMEIGRETVIPLLKLLALYGKQRERISATCFENVFANLAFTPIAGLNIKIYCI